MGRRHILVFCGNDRCHHQAELDAYLAHNEATEAEFSREIARLFPRGAALKERIKQSAAEEHQNQIIDIP